MNRYPDMGGLGPDGGAGGAARRAGRAAGARAGVGRGARAAHRGDLRPGDEVVFAWRSFEAYPILVTLAGAVPVQVPLGAGERHDLVAMAAAITDRARGWCCLHAEQPDGHRSCGDCRARGVPRAGALGRARRPRRGVPRVRDRAGLAGRARDPPVAAERRGAADLLEGVRARRDCGSGTPWRTSRSPRRCARPRFRSG